MAAKLGRPMMSCSLPLAAPMQPKLIGCPSSLATADDAIALLMQGFIAGKRRKRRARRAAQKEDGKKDEPEVEGWAGEASMCTGKRTVRAFLWV